MYLESKLNEAHELAEELVSRLETVVIELEEYEEQTMIGQNQAGEILHVLDELYARLDILNDPDYVYTWAEQL
jgi:50S ribosomal subunit-associated GTPase HflX